MSLFSRLARVATATALLAGIVTIVAAPGCSGTGASGFPDTPDGGVGGIDAFHIVTGLDGTVVHHDTGIVLMNGNDTGTQKMGINHEAGFSDAKVKVDATGCVEPDAAAAAPPLKHTCIIYPAGADDNNECDGHHDPPAPYPANGSMGNGFDDNCNGLVDEGCSCDNVGTTKPCYLVPASQTENCLPVGWCATNSKGTVACAQQGEGAPTWSGVCRGAQPPYAADVCAAGDFNCDGAQENAPGGCACKVATITCPTMPLTTVPYPPPGALPLEVNAASWFSDPAEVSQATNWKWSMTGGDCDNILPFPTFAIYSSAVGTGSPINTTSTTLGMSGKEHGTVATGAGLSAIFPAFSLSGDYLLTASWELNGQPYTCTLQVDVRAPGLRAEACWDTEKDGDDLDLHMAKVNGFTQCATTHAWSDLACMSANEDCFYEECYAGFGGVGDTVNWGFPTSAATACTGWGSQSTGTTCGNPRLDRDANGLSGTCDPTVNNPNGGGLIGPFCGPENINLDAPANGDQYAVAVRFYNQSGTTNPHVHSDIYCNGERILSSGYDPVAGNNFPQLATPGQDSTGDMWKVATVTTTVTGGVLSCTVLPTQSKVANPTLDGPTTAYCVDDAQKNTSQSQEFLTQGGGVPSATVATALCFH